MKSLIKRFLLCPVPDDQKPINQYIEGKENIFTSFLFEPSNKKLEKALNISVFSFLFCFVVQFSGNIALLLNSLRGSIIVNFSILLGLFAITLFRWGEIYNLFSSSSVIYEEASWFDSQFWEKPFFIIKNDTFLATQKLRPQLKSLSKLIWKIVSLSFFSLFFLNFFFIGTIIR